MLRKLELRNTLEMQELHQYMLVQMEFKHWIFIFRKISLNEGNAVSELFEEIEEQQSN